MSSECDVKKHAKCLALDATKIDIKDMIKVIVFKADYKTANIY